MGANDVELASLVTMKQKYELLFSRRLNTCKTSLISNNRRHETVSLTRVQIYEHGKWVIFGWFLLHFRLGVSSLIIVKTLFKFTGD